MTWAPIISDNQNPPFIEKIHQIAQTLANNTQNLTFNDGFMADRIGAALFFFYYSRATGKNSYAEIGYDLLSIVFEELNQEMESGRCKDCRTGLPGLGWTMEHLTQNGFIDIDTDSILTDIDDLMNQAMQADMKVKNYDFLDGAITKGIYFLSRIRHQSSHLNLTALIDTMADVCDKVPGRGYRFLMKWMENNEEKSYCNMGLAHGMPGVAWFLGKLIEKEIAVEKTSHLLDEFVSYILGTMQDISQNLSYFPNLVVPGDTPSNSRLAWCFGDLGIGVALWQISQSKKNKEWEDKALIVLRHTTKRRDLAINKVIDAGMCHGTAGIAHMYNRIYAYTKDEIFKEAALFWFDETMKMAVHPDGYAGFKCWKGEENGGWHNVADIIDGVSGIGLALLSAAFPIEPSWDRMMLLS